MDLTWIDLSCIMGLKSVRQTGDFLYRPALCVLTENVQGLCGEMADKRLVRLHTRSSTDLSTAEKCLPHLRPIPPAF